MRVVILGGGPIGLLCAIEAKKHFKDVLIIEKRSAYTRPNVPQFNDPALLKKVLELDPQKKLAKDQAYQGGHLGPLRDIEKTLFERANGVTMKRPYVVTYAMGTGEPFTHGSDTRYPKIALLLWRWDDKKKEVDQDSPHEIVIADLVVVATGGGAIADPVITQILGFEYEKLKPKNYMAYGIFELPGQAEPADNDVKERLEKFYATVTGDACISYPTRKESATKEDYHYFLPKLAVTKTDYKNLDASEKQKAEKRKLGQELKACDDLLARLLVGLKPGHSMSEGVLESIKAVEKNMQVFKIKIQRARQFYSPKYPAVLVGDAAVTPHPDTGSGLTSGFRGYEELTLLLEALKNTDTPMQAYQSFNDRYHLHVSYKALHGTASIIEGHIDLLKEFVAKCKRVEVSHNEAFPYLIAAAEALKKRLEEDKQEADNLTSQAKTLSDSIQVKPNRAVPQAVQKWDWDGTAGQLWKRLKVTYEQLKKLTAGISVLRGKIEAAEKDLGLV